MFVDIDQMLCSKLLLQLLPLRGFSLISLFFTITDTQDFPAHTSIAATVHWAGQPDSLTPAIRSRHHCQTCLIEIATSPCHSSAQKCFCKSLQMKSNILGPVTAYCQFLTQNTQPKLIMSLFSLNLKHLLMISSTWNVLPHLLHQTKISTIPYFSHWTCTQLLQSSLGSTKYRNKDCLQKDRTQVPILALEFIYQSV